MSRKTYSPPKVQRASVDELVDLVGKLMRVAVSEPMKWKLSGATTGRFDSSRPNKSNVPRSK